jgi:hypothetical protein
MLYLRTRYRGFRLIAYSHSGDDGLHSASIIIEKPGYPARCFNDLDFFHDGDDALSYATTWGRIWIEANVQFPDRPKLAAFSNQEPGPGRPALLF